MTTLLLKANWISQVVSDWTYPFVNLNWNNNACAWQFRQNKKQVWFNSCLNFGCVGFPAQMMLQYLLLVILLKPEWFTIKQILAVVMLSALLPIAFLEDFMMSKHRRDVLGVSNWKLGYEMGSKLKQDSPLLVVLLKSELDKFKSGLPVDKYGLFAVYFVGLVQLFGFLIVGYLIHGNIDPIYVFRMTIQKIGGPDLNKIPGFQVFRYSATLHLSMYVCVMFRFSAMLYIAVIEMNVSGPKKLLNGNLSYQKIKAYKQYYICQQNINSFEGPFVCAWLMLSFTLILMGLNVSFLCYDHLPLNLHLVGPLAATAETGLVMLAFQGGCSLFETSSAAIDNWKYMLEKWSHSKRMRKTIASLRPFATPVGSVTTMNKDEKIGYFAQIQDYFLTTVMMSKEMLDY